MAEVIKDLSKLSVRSEEINIKDKLEEVKSTISELHNFLDEHKDLLAVSAPQLGINQRILVLRYEGEYKDFINPMITKFEGAHFVREKDICIGDVEFIVPRHDRIMVMYQTKTGMPENNRIEGIAAELFQHHVNLLDGVTIADFGLEIDEEWDKASEEEREEVLKLYYTKLQEQSAELQKEIDSDEELHRLDKAIKFMNGVADGSVKLEEPKLNRAQRRAKEKLEKKLAKIKGNK